MIVASVTTVQKNSDDYLYQYAKINKDTGKPDVGSYFYDNENVDITKLGFDVQGRVKIKVKLVSNSDFLKSTAADIEDWAPNSTKIFDGGEIQLFNPNANYSEVTIINFDTLNVLVNSKVKLSWRMDDATENKLPKKYIVVKSSKENGTYTMIYESKNKLSYTDVSPLPINYYKIGAITFDNDTIYSYSRLATIIDTIPPNPPKGLKATSDSKGNVLVSWDKNTEDDIQGYKIFKANAINEEFVQMNSQFLKSPEFKDKLNLKTLSKKMYYKVVATDNNYNNSLFSTVTEVKRPDTIAPIAPIITVLKMQQNGIVVNWLLSSSDDAKQYVLYHQNSKNKIDVKLKEWFAKDSLKQFIDTLVEFGETYQYKMVITDEEDNMSISNIQYMKFETGYRKKMTDIKIDVDRTLREIKLSWQDINNDIEKFIIYRAKKSEPLSIIKTVNGNINNYSDTQLNIGNVYEYRIKAVYKNGVESIISDAVKIEY